MENYKICFIICGNNDFLCQETLHYILNLYIPDKFELDYMIISDVKNTFEAYNAGMKESDAKYKIYLNENVFITDKSFLVNVIDIFANNPDIGQIGAIGFRNNHKNEPENMERIGHITVGGTETKIYNFNCNTEFALEEVVTMEPGIVVTAYDENWPEGKDVAAAMLERCESLRNSGYKSVALIKEKPWCLYDNDLLGMSE